MFPPPVSRISHISLSHLSNSRSCSLTLRPYSTAATDASNMPDAKIPKVLSVSYAWYELQQCEISPSVAPCAGGNVTKVRRPCCWVFFV